MLLKVLLLVTVTAAIRAEVSGRAPYAPAGWRPRVPFNLPDEYLPPVDSSLEVSRQRIEHAGTLNEAQLNSNYLPPKLDQQPVSRERQTQFPQQRPAAQYGAPGDGTFRINYPDEEESPATTDLPQNIKEGRYYIVSPDNKLQRVVYRTAANAAEEGFTAQLKYSSVGELQDPVYKYNRQGQLERVLK